MASEQLAMDPISVQQRKAKFVEYIGLGLTPRQALKKCGYKNSNGSAGTTIRNLMNDPEVQRGLARIQESNKAEMEITREKVQSIVLEAIDMGRTLADPMSIIRGAQELNKMCGFYAPEEKKVTLTAAQRRMTAKYDEISDEDLISLINEQDKANAIEAEFEEIPEADQLATVSTKFSDRQPYDPEEG